MAAGSIAGVLSLGNRRTSCRTLRVSGHKDPWSGDGFVVPGDDETPLQLMGSIGILRLKSWRTRIIEGIKGL